MSTIYDSAVTALLTAGFSAEAAHEEACREVRLTTGDIYFGRTVEERDEMERQEAEMYAAVRDSAGCSEEFPAGEFAVAGFNCDFDWEEDR